MKIIDRVWFLACAVALPSFIASMAQAETRMVVAMAGEAFDGAPAYEVRMGDAVVASGTLTASVDTVNDGRLFFNPAPEDFIERVEFAIDDADFDPTASVTVVLTNDKFVQERWGHDRNIFVHSVEINGLVVRAAGLQLMNKGERELIDYQAGFMPIYNKDQAAVAPAPQDGWPLPASASSALPEPLEVGKAGG